MHDSKTSIIKRYETENENLPLSRKIAPFKRAGSCFSSEVGRHDHQTVKISPRMTRGEAA